MGYNTCTRYATNNQEYITTQRRYAMVCSDSRIATGMKLKGSTKTRPTTKRTVLRAAVRQVYDEKGWQSREKSKRNGK